MHRMAGIHFRSLTIAEDTLLLGIVLAPVRVLPGVRLTVRGIVLGGLVLEAGATAEIAGIVNGRIDQRPAVSLDYAARSNLPAQGPVRQGRPAR
ncbi:hypothetical protein [Methylobrevis albus]|uniref:Uncharacterized protein n=1 Tax=Methylobrevis albus TaxID=2793297 RepID=A0A931I0U3_9HYPH|nr:hypothetical protein [Methylobrevis albus]MBH0236901.1 hypothetical protein [Methylobrevis albus]